MVGDQTHLDYLYVLTVADVRGTNPKLWNNWKSSLFAEFYERTQAGAAPRPGKPDRQGRADRRDAGARPRAADSRRRAASSAATNVWQRFTDAYFLRHTPEEIAWHTQHARPSATPTDTASLVSVQQQSGRGGTGISTYTPQTQHSFARTTALLDQLGLNIVDARITPTADGFSLDVYHVLEDTGAEITDPRRASATSSSSSRMRSAKPDDAT